MGLPDKSDDDLPCHRLPKPNKKYEQLLLLLVFYELIFILFKNITFIFNVSLTFSKIRKNPQILEAKLHRFALSYFSTKVDRTSKLIINFYYFLLGTLK